LQSATAGANKDDWFSVYVEAPKHMHDSQQQHLQHMWALTREASSLPTGPEVGVAQNQSHWLRIALVALMEPTCGWQGKNLPFGHHRRRLCTIHLFTPIAIFSPYEEWVSCCIESKRLGALVIH